MLHVCAILQTKCATLYSTVHNFTQFYTTLQDSTKLDKTLTIQKLATQVYTYVHNFTQFYTTLEHCYSKLYKTKNFFRILCNSYTNNSTQLYKVLQYLQTHQNFTKTLHTLQTLQNL